MTVGVGCPSRSRRRGGRETPRRPEPRTQMRTPDSTSSPRRPTADGAAAPRRRSGSCSGATGSSAAIGRRRLRRGLAGPRRRSSSATWRSRWCRASGATRERSRVEREALAAARLNHPGIVALYEFGSDDEDVYLVSELVNGATLEELTREGAVSDRDVARIGQALCDALEHAHARGVIHRDVKPANVMVLAEPAAGAGFAKLTDFGIAHLASGEDLTATGDVVGTLAYMAPEQAEGRRVTARLRRLLAGADPLRGLDRDQPRPRPTARRPPRAGWAGRCRRSRGASAGPPAGAVRGGRRRARPRPRPTAPRRRSCARCCTTVEGDLSRRGRPGGARDARALRADRRADADRVRTLLHRHAPDADELPREPGLALLAPRIARRARPPGCWCSRPSRRSGPTPPFSARLAGLAARRPGGGAARGSAGSSAALFVCGWLGTPEADRPGTALVLAAALAPTPLLLPRAGPAVVGARPGAAAGRGGARPAVRGRGGAGLHRVAPRRAWRRPGFLWLAVAEVLTGDDAAVRRRPTARWRARAWEGSVLDAAGDALWPLVSSPALAPGGGVGGVRRWCCRSSCAAAGRRWTCVGAALWVAGLVAAHGVLGDLLAATTELDRARGAVAGAALGGLVAVTVTLLAPPRARRPRPPALP